MSKPFDRNAGIALGAVVIFGVSIFTWATSDSAKGPQGSTHTVYPVIGSPEDLINNLRRDRGPYPDLALGEANELVTKWPGTPEAKEATGLIPELEAAAARRNKSQMEAARIQEARNRKKDLADKWVYKHFEDEMTSKTVRSAGILSENSVEFKFPYDGTQFGSLRLMKPPGEEGDVMFQIEKGQIEMGPMNNFPVELRFDQEEPKMWDAVGSSDHDKTTIFIKPCSKFVRKLRAAKQVKVRLEVYENGIPTFTFAVAGFDNELFEGKKAAK